MLVALVICKGIKVSDLLYLAAMIHGYVATTFREICLAYY